MAGHARERRLKLALEEVNLEAADEQYTVLVHGDTGSGKTRFAASWPDTLFLAVNDEKGWETIRWMESSNFYEGRKPRVWKLKKATDLVEAHKDVQPLIAAGKVKTIVIDSLTFWVEMFYDHLLTQMGNKDNRQVYGVLGDHMRNVRIKFHQLNCNVIWLCTTRQPDEPTKLAMPEIKGKSALTFPAGCKYVWYMRSAQEGKRTAFNLHTRKFGNVMARGRDGGRLPDPIENPSYLKIHEALQGISVEEFVDKSEEELIAEAAADAPALDNLEAPLFVSDPPASVPDKQVNQVKPAVKPSVGVISKNPASSPTIRR